MRALVLRRRLAVGALLLAALAGGCGLLDELDKLRTIKFQLPAKTYRIDARDPRWKAPPPEGVPAITCGAGGVVSDCCRPPAPAPAIDCGRFPLSCEQNLCALKFTYEQVEPVDLGREAGELQAVGGQIISNVTITSIDISMKNTLSLTPPVHIYVGPAAAKSATHPSARRIATLPRKPLGWSGSESIPLTEDAQRTFAELARDFQTPFNIIISTTVVLDSMSVSAQGALEVTVSGSAEASF